MGKILLALGALLLAGTLGIGWLGYRRQATPVFAAIEPMYMPMFESPERVRLFPMQDGKAVGVGHTVAARWAQRALVILTHKGERKPSAPPFTVQWDAVAKMQAGGQQGCLFVGYEQSAIALGFGPACKPQNVEFSAAAAQALKSLFEEGLPRG